MTQNKLNHFSRKMLCILAALLLTVSLSACGNHTETSSSSVVSEISAAETSYTGTVTEISGESLTLSTEDGSSVSIPLSENTVFTRGRMEGGKPEGQQPPDDLPADSAGEPSANEESSDSGEATLKQFEGGTQQEPGMKNSPPEKTDGGNNAGGDTPPEIPEGEMPSDMGEMTWENISVGDTVTVTVGSDGYAETVTISGGNMGGNMGGGPGGASSAPDSYDSANEYTADAQISNTELSSSGVDENAVLVATEGVTASLDSVTILRESDSSTGGDSSSFYGVGAAALVTEGTLSISNSTITSDAAGGAGVFAYGNGTAYVSDTTITTMRDTSGGIHVAGGGTLYAWDLTVGTNGESSAAIRSDRGSGTMVVDGGSYTSNGVGSPAVYSTADITVYNAELTANGSEAICIEGLNTIRLFDCDLTGNMSDLEQNDCTWNVILYQSMSGDSEVGNSTFEMVGGSLTAKNGGMFYTTNTESTFILSGVDITYAQDSEFLLKCTGNSNQRGWGTSGANGADCHFTAIDQVLEGDILWDSISQLDFYLTQGSTLTGSVIQDESNAGNGGSGYGNLVIDADSSWIVTGDSVLTTLDCAGTITDNQGNSVSIVGTDGTVYVSGDSSYTITVENYTANGDASGASTLDSWENFSVEKP